MFFEKLGKYCFSLIRPSFFYFLIASPILFTSSYLIFQYSRLTELEQRFSDACKKGQIALERKGRKERFLTRYSHGDPYFLDQQIESLAFLQKEKKELEILLKHPALADKHLIEERLQFLLSSQNRLSFTEEAIRSSSTAKEIEEKQRYPVEMDAEDLKNLLSFLEDVSIDSFHPVNLSPQIIITDFQLQKKKTSVKTNVLEVEMKLLTRDFLK